MKNLEKIINLIGRKIKDFQQSKSLKFKDIIKANLRPKGGKLDFPGVYIIYERGNGLIYIGSTGKSGRFLRHRLGELFYYNPKNKNEDSIFAHTLTRHLFRKYKKVKSKSALKNYLFEKCHFKYIKTVDVREARMIEDVLIVLLNPKYNQE